MFASALQPRGTADPATGAGYVCRPKHKREMRCRVSGGVLQNLNPRVPVPREHASIHAATHTGCAPTKPALGRASAR